MTVTVAVPEIAPLVAVTVFGERAGAAPAVNSPSLALMVPPPFTTDHTGVIAMTLPLGIPADGGELLRRARLHDAGFGVTVIVASATGRRR